MPEPPPATVSDVLHRVWSDLGAAQPAATGSVVWGTALALAVVVVWPASWRKLRHLITIAHEGSHGLAALLTGRRQRGISLRFDSSGTARSHGRTRGPRLIVTTAAGYPGPALLGLGGALLLAGGYVGGVLWVTVALLAVLLLQLRSAWGVLVVVAAGGVLAAVAWLAGPELRELVAYALTWALLLGAPRPVVELWRRHRRGQRGSDADVLAQLTGCAASCWIAVLLATNVALLAGGAWLLLTP